MLSIKQTVMNYEETLEYLYRQLPVFQQVGSAAYKPGLQNSEALDEYFGHPHRKFHTLHIAGTNGKGSVSHLLASILQLNGYKTGLYTSPHLVDFRERIRIDGQMIPRQEVIDFAEKHLAPTLHIHPSFFELTMMMAFDYFARQAVDAAVIEVGLGGRLDSTNIITPDLCVITNISYDHVQMLGHTLPQIAREKAGIIKHGIPVVIGEAQGEVKQVFIDKASEVGAPIFFAEECVRFDSARQSARGWEFDSPAYPHLFGELGGLCQEKNAATVLTAVARLRELGYRITDQSVYEAFAHVTRLTGLMGRWQQLQASPRLICDTGHNTGGMQYIARQLRNEHYDMLRIVIGMVNDKDISGVLAMLPKEATYYFTRASVPRALPQDKLEALATQTGLKGRSFPTVKEAVTAAQKESRPEDLIFVGGSTFIVADLLQFMPLPQ